MPVAAAARECVQALVGGGYTDVDFAALIELQARASGLDLDARGRARPRRPDAGAARRAVVTDYLAAYERMLLIRAFEHAMHRLFLAGEVHGTTHLCAGQEAVPSACAWPSSPGDYVAGTYRGHGHALAKGADPDALAAETPVPYSPTLEDAYIPDAQAIASAVRARLGVRALAS